MKFKEITIENFKGIKGITYTPLNKTAVLIGKNGLGKTSFLEGIRFLITGNTPDNCIFDGADSTTVSGILEDDTNFSRMKHLTKPSKVTVNGKVAKPAAAISEGDVIAITFGEKTTIVRVEKVVEHALKADASNMYTIL
jgi:recombinational DNA repair ATPase RecF